MAKKVKKAPSKTVKKKPAAGKPAKPKKTSSGKKSATPSLAPSREAGAEPREEEGRERPAVRHVSAEIVDSEPETDDSPAFGEPEPELDPDFEDEADSALEGSDDDPEEPEAKPRPARSRSPSAARLPASADRSLATTDPIALYLQEIRKYPVLSREEELEIAKRYYETKDPAAAQALVTANLRFVVKVAAEYSKFGARLIDLVQEGNMGLMHAVRDFNPYKGVRLITYAVWWIRGYIQEYLMKQYSLVKIGTTQNQKKLFYRLQKEKEALDALGEAPDVNLIGSRLGIPAEEVHEMAQRLKGRDVSLSQTLDENSKGSLLDLQKSEEAEPDEALARMEELKLLRDRLDELRPRLSERELILLDERLLADEPLTLQEIGEKYGITREAVRQMEVRLLDKIRKSLEA